jgi:hypothetical protein
MVSSSALSVGSASASSFSLPAISSMAADAPSMFAPDKSFDSAVRPPSSSRNMAWPRPSWLPACANASSMREDTTSIEAIAALVSGTTSSDMA